tara:strand:- start:66 stop:428 length:363 start_codon:yes stop_codon:yes gene_type:complete
MITLIILTVLTGIGIYLITKGWDYEVLGGIMTTIFGLWLIIHTISILTVSYEYEMFVVKREAFEKTLNDSRKNGNDFETAAIVKEVAEWNVKLAEYKYDNTTLYFDQFIDDRIDTLEPIE